MISPANRARLVRPLECAALVAVLAPRQELTNPRLRLADGLGALPLCRAKLAHGSKTFGRFAKLVLARLDGAARFVVQLGNGYAHETLTPQMRVLLI